MSSSTALDQGRPNAAYFVAAATTITLLCAAIRILGLGGDSLWFDEILTRNTAVQGVAAAFTVRDHPPLIYALVTAVLRLLPDHEAILRLPAATAGILSVPLLIAFGRATRLPRAGLWAGLLLALLPFHLRYSQEARHYALLLFFSLLATYWLYRALTFNRLRAWLFYSLAMALNLLTHYSAWLLLIAQGVVIFLWSIAVIRRAGWPALKRAFLAALVLGGTLLLLAPRALTTFSANAGAVVAGGTTQAATLPTWLREIWLAFGFDAALPAALLALGALLGLALLFTRRRLLLLGLIVSTAVVPILLIQLLNVSRWALPKYVIYMLPLYLLANGVALAGITRALAAALPGQRPDGARTALVALPLAGLLFLAAWRPLQAERTSVVRDWRGAVAAAESHLAPGDIVLAVALDTPDGYNAGGIAAAYYLDRQLRLIDGNHLSWDGAEKLVGQEGRVAALALNSKRPVQSSSDSWRVTPFAHGLFAVVAAEPGEDVAEQAVGLLDFLAGQADDPSPRCSLEQKAALLSLLGGQVEEAHERLTAANPDCPLDEREREELSQAIDRQRLAVAMQQNDGAQARQLARSLLKRNPGDEQALAALTYANLLALFAAGSAEVSGAVAPEQPGVRSWTMPQTGEAGNVLFVHPPAEVSFFLQLPPEEVLLRTRLALDPQSWAWGGDGATFVLRVETAEGQQELLRKHISNDADGQRWHDVAIDLAPYAGQEVTIILATEVGPSGDGTGDWAGWETPRLIVGPAE